MSAPASPARTLGGVAGYLALAGAITVLAMLPGEAVPRRWPVPDVLLLVTLAWLVRRPAHLPAASLAFVFLAADFVTGQPPGLRAALVLIAAEHLRARAGADGAGPSAAADGPIAEWARAGAAILLIAFAEHALLGLTLTPAPEMGPVLLRAISGALLYPASALFVAYVLNVRRAPRRPAAGPATEAGT